MSLASDQTLPSKSRLTLSFASCWHASAVLTSGTIVYNYSDSSREKRGSGHLGAALSFLECRLFLSYRDLPSGCSCAGEPGNIVSYLSEKSDAAKRETERLDLSHQWCILYVRLNLHLPGAIVRVSWSGARSSHVRESRMVRVGTLLESPTTDDLRTGAGSTRCTRGVLTPLHSFRQNALRALCLIFSMKEGKHEV